MQQSDASTQSDWPVATVSRGWLLRMAILTAALVAITGWCLYDGLVKYPAINRQLDQQQGVEIDGEKAPVAVTAESEGELTEEDRKTQGDIAAQFVMAAICLALAGGFGGRMLWAYSRSIEARSDGLKATDGTVIPYDAITGIDKRKWDRKSLAIVHYAMNGRQDSTRIDDWIFDGAGEVLEKVEARTDFEGEEEDSTEA